MSKCAGRRAPTTSALRIWSLVLFCPQARRTGAGAAKRRARRRTGTGTGTVTGTGIATGTATGTGRTGAAARVRDMHLHASELHASELPVLVCCLSLRSKLFDQACFCTNQVARHSSWPEPHELFRPPWRGWRSRGKMRGGWGRWRRAPTAASPGRPAWRRGRRNGAKRGAGAAGVPRCVGQQREAARAEGARSVAVAVPGLTEREHARASRSGSARRRRSGSGRGMRSPPARPR